MPIIIDGDSAVYLKTNFASFNSVSSNSLGSGVMEMIPLDVSYGGVLTYSSNNPNEMTTTEGRLSQIEITLTNADGSLFNLPTNAEVLAKFRVVLDE